VVVADEDVGVVVTVAVEAHLLPRRDRVAAHDQASLLAPGLRLPVEARDLAAGPVAGGLPVESRYRLDPRFDRGDLRCADGVADPEPLKLGEEVLAPEAFVGAQVDGTPTGTRSRHSTMKRRLPREATAAPLRSLPCSHSPLSPTKQSSGCQATLPV
jgi:hypothetical protein